MTLEKEICFVCYYCNKKLLLNLVDEGVYSDDVTKLLEYKVGIGLECVVVITMDYYKHTTKLTQ